MSGGGEVTTPPPLGDSSVLTAPKPGLPQAIDATAISKGIPKQYAAVEGVAHKPAFSIYNEEEVSNGTKLHNAARGVTEALGKLLDEAAKGEGKKAIDATAISKGIPKQYAAVEGVAHKPAFSVYNEEEVSNGTKLHNAARGVTEALGKLLDEAAKGEGKKAIDATAISKGIPKQYAAVEGVAHKPAFSVYNEEEVSNGTKLHNAARNVTEALGELLDKVPTKGEGKKAIDATAISEGIPKQYPAVEGVANKPAFSIYNEEEVSNGTNLYDAARSVTEALGELLDKVPTKGEGNKAVDETVISEGNPKQYPAVEGVANNPAFSIYNEEEVSNATNLHNPGRGVTEALGKLVDGVPKFQSLGDDDTESIDSGIEDDRDLSDYDDDLISSVDPTKGVTVANNAANTISTSKSFSETIGLMQNEQFSAEIFKGRSGGNLYTAARKVTESLGKLVDGEVLSVRNSDSGIPKSSKELLELNEPKGINISPELDGLIKAAEGVRDKLQDLLVKLGDNSLHSVSYSHDKVKTVEVMRKDLAVFIGMVSSGGLRVESLDGILGKLTQDFASLLDLNIPPRFSIPKNAKENGEKDPIMNVYTLINQKIQADRGKRNASASDLWENLNSLSRSIGPLLKYGRDHNMGVNKRSINGTGNNKDLAVVTRLQDFGPMNIRDMLYVFFVQNLPPCKPESYAQLRNGLESAKASALTNLLWRAENILFNGDSARKYVDSVVYIRSNLGDLQLEVPVNSNQFVNLLRPERVPAILKGELQEFIKSELRFEVKPVAAIDTLNSIKTGFEVLSHETYKDLGKTAQLTAAILSESADFAMDSSVVDPFVGNEGAQLAEQGNTAVNMPILKTIGIQNAQISAALGAKNESKQDLHASTNENANLGLLKGLDFNFRDMVYVFCVQNLPSCDLVSYMKLHSSIMKASNISMVKLLWKVQKNLVTADADERYIAAVADLRINIADDASGKADPQELSKLTGARRGDEADAIVGPIGDFVRSRLQIKLKFIEDSDRSERQHGGLQSSMLAELGRGLIGKSSDPNSAVNELSTKVLLSGDEVRKDLVKTMNLTEVGLYAAQMQQPSADNESRIAKRELCSFIARHFDKGMNADDRKLGSDTKPKFPQENSSVLVGEMQNLSELLDVLNSGKKAPLGVENTGIMPQGNRSSRNR